MAKKIIAFISILCEKATACEYICPDGFKIYRSKYDTLIKYLYDEGYPTLDTINVEEIREIILKSLEHMEGGFCAEKETV